MTLHLAEIAQAVAPGAHAIVLLDQAGWHLSKRLVIPTNITLVPLPAKAPELNPVENVWQFLRDNWLSNRVFPLLRGHPRPLLCSVEQAHRPALVHHVHWPTRLGSRVLINETRC
jgi:transposase